MADPILHSADARTLLARIEAPDPAAIEVAVKAIEAIQSGATTGEWQPFLDLLAPDISFFAPVPGFAEKGLLKGKRHAEELFGHHNSVTRTEWLLQSAWVSGREVLFESRIEGTIEGKEHAVQVVMAFVIRDGLVAQFREYASYMSPEGRSWDSKSAARDTFAYRG